MVVPELPLAPPDLVAAFGRDRPRMLDIGCGNGEAAGAWAVDHPDQDVLAVELHRPGIVQLLRWLDERPATDPVTNLRLVEADATALLAGALPGTFDRVRVLFPDPWPKRRHLERRLVDGPFVAAMADLLPSGGTLHLATDWYDYADQMRQALAAEPRFIPQPEVEGEAPGARDDVRARSGAGADPRWTSRRPDRPITAYERRGIRAGRSITDLVARRV